MYQSNELEGRLTNKMLNGGDGINALVWLSVGKPLDTANTTVADLYLIKKINNIDVVPSIQNVYTLAL